MLLHFDFLQWALCLLVNCVPAMDINTTWCMKRYNGCGYNSMIALYAAFSVIYLPSYVLYLRIVFMGKCLLLCLKKVERHIEE